METFEYIGFIYEVRHTSDGIKIIPVPGQHAAASKDKHRMAARDKYMEEKGLK